MENHQSKRQLAFLMVWDGFISVWHSIQAGSNHTCLIFDDNKHDRIDDEEEDDGNKVVVCEYAKLWGRPSVRKASAWVRLSTSVSLLTTTTQSATSALQFTLSSTVQALPLAVPPCAWLCIAPFCIVRWCSGGGGVMVHTGLMGWKRLTGRWFRTKEISQGIIFNIKFVLLP